MSRSSRSSLLEEEIALLIKHFGVARVRATLRKVANGSDDGPQKALRTSTPRVGRLRPSVAELLEILRASDPEKHRLLSEFLNQLKERKVLPESQDIRHFAHLIGLKNVSGKSRKDMITPLMRFLLEQPNERLWTDLEKANHISEQQRQQGFSVLTDKLLGKNDAAARS
jgi:hypothetical protein